MNGLLRWDDPRLKQISQPVGSVDEAAPVVSQLITIMDATRALGIAAPQIGVLSRIIVVDPSGGHDLGARRVLINPQIEVCDPGLMISNEGCLSLPGIALEILRSRKIKISYKDLSWNDCSDIADDRIGAICQHEVDHLDGILMSDRVSRHVRRGVASYLRKSTK